jgi:hypothetical protein
VKNDWEMIHWWAEDGLMDFMGKVSNFICGMIRNEVEMKDWRNKR